MISSSSQNKARGVWLVGVCLAATQGRVGLGGDRPASVGLGSEPHPSPLASAPLLTHGQLRLGCLPHPWSCDESEVGRQEERGAGIWLECGRL